MFHKKIIQRITEYLRALLEGSEPVVPQKVPGDQKECWSALKDVAKLVQDEKEKERLYQQVRRALNESIAGILVLDADGMMTFVNQAWENFTGYKTTELLHKHVSMLQEKVDYEKGLKLLLSNAGVTGAHVTDINLLTANGSSITVWMQCLLNKENDEVKGYTLIGRDVTAQKRVENELKKRSKELEKLNEHMIGREMRMKELKEENEELQRQINVLRSQK